MSLVTQRAIRRSTADDGRITVASGIIQAFEERGQAQVRALHELAGAGLHVKPFPPCWCSRKMPASHLSGSLTVPYSCRPCGLKHQDCSGPCRAAQYYDARAGWMNSTCFQASAYYGSALACLSVAALADTFLCIRNGPALLLPDRRSISQLTRTRCSASERASACLR